MTDFPTNGHDYDQVEPACPRCGEDDIDRLVWIDDDQVRCARCGHVYTVNEVEGK